MALYLRIMEECEDIILLLLDNYPRAVIAERVGDIYLKAKEGKQTLKQAR